MKDKVNFNTTYVVIEATILENEYLSSSDKIVYATISALSNNKDGYCYLTYKSLSNKLKIQERQLYYSIKRLKEQNYLITCKKGQRTFLMPSTSALIRARQLEPKKYKELFSYDWLDDNE